jgi:hypothetical protein
MHYQILHNVFNIIFITEWPTKINCKLKILAQESYLNPEKAIPYQNKYKYNLEWNYLEEIIHFGYLL